MLQRDPRRVYHADALHVPRPTPLHRPYPQLLRRLREDLLRASAVAAAASSGAALNIGQAPTDRGEAGGGPATAQGTVIVVQRTELNNQHTHQHPVCAGGLPPYVHLDTDYSL